MNSNLDTQPDLSLRARHKLATRDAILLAVARLLESGGLAHLSFAEIAREAGIGESTAYRYFPSKEALLEAFWAYAPQAINRDRLPETFEQLSARLAPDFEMFDAREPLIRGMLASPLGRASRRDSRVERQRAFRALVKHEVGDLAPKELDHLCAAIQLLYSATTWATFKDYWGMDGEEAGHAATRAIGALLDDARRKLRKKKKALSKSDGA